MSVSSRDQEHFDEQSNSGDAGPGISDAAGRMVLFVSIISNSTACHSCKVSLCNIMARIDPDALRDICEATKLPSAVRVRSGWNEPEGLILVDPNLFPKHSFDVALWMKMKEDPQWWSEVWKGWMVLLEQAKSGYAFDETLGSEWRWRLWSILCGKFTIIDISRGRDVETYLQKYVGYVKGVYMRSIEEDNRASGTWECQCPHAEKIKMNCLDRHHLKTMYEDAEAIAMPLAIENMDEPVREMLSQFPNVESLSIRDFVKLWEDSNEAIEGLVELAERGAEEVNKMAADVEGEKARADRPQDQGSGLVACAASAISYARETCIPM